MVTITATVTATVTVTLTLTLTVTLQITVAVAVTVAVTVAVSGDRARGNSGGCGHSDLVSLYRFESRSGVREEH